MDPPPPIRLDLFRRSSAGLSESFSRLNRKQSRDTMALDKSATIDSEPEITKYNCLLELSLNYFLTHEVEIIILNLILC